MWLVYLLSSYFTDPQDHRPSVWGKGDLDTSTLPRRRFDHLAHRLNIAGLVVPKIVGPALLQSQPILVSVNRYFFSMFTLSLLLLCELLCKPRCVSRHAFMTRSLLSCMSWIAPSGVFFSPPGQSSRILSSQMFLKVHFL